MDEKTLVCVARIDVTQIFWTTSPDAREDLHVTCRCYCPNYLWEFQFNQPEKIWNPAPTKRFCNHSDVRIFHDLLEDPSLQADAQQHHLLWNFSPDEKRRSEESVNKEFDHRLRQDSFWMDKKTFTIFLPFFFVGVRSLFWCIYMKHDRSKVVY